MPRTAMVVSISREAAVNDFLMRLFLHLSSSGALGMKRRRSHTRQIYVVRPVCGDTHGWGGIPRGERGIGAGDRVGSPGPGVARASPASLLESIVLRALFSRLGRVRGVKVTQSASRTHQIRWIMYLDASLGDRRRANSPVCLRFCDRECIGGCDHPHY